MLARKKGKRETVNMARDLILPLNMVQKGLAIHEDQETLLL